MYSIPLLSFIISFSASIASADVLFPINEQLPLIARVGQPYSWSISPSTFSGQNITSSTLPSWLSFSDLTFSGTPGGNDEGSVNITLSDGVASDKFSLCVTHFPPPVLNLSLVSQFKPSNPSMSSVFFLSPHSALTSENPAVRIPLHWSFSIGFDGGTFVNTHELFYYARLANGSLLPDWISFNGNTVTFDGVARSPPVNETDRYRMVLIASDQEGYSAAQVPFDLLIFSHELRSLMGGISLNATAGEDFELDFNQDGWVFNSILLDNSTISSDNITSIGVDTTSLGWLAFDSSSRILKGKAPITTETAPTSITIVSSNQTLLLNSTISILPSYFTGQTIPQVLANPDSDYTLSLRPFISTNTLFQDHAIDISVSSDCTFLNLTRTLDDEYAIAGHIPLNPSTSYSDFTLTAYDHTTHAASHASLRINYRVPYSDAKRSSALVQRRKLILGLSISIGSTVGLIILAGLIAVTRKYHRTKETEANREGYDSGKSKAQALEDSSGGGHGWSEKVSPSPDMVSRGIHSHYPNLGVTRTPTLMPGSPPPKKTTKRAFFTNVREAVRNFSAGSSTRKSVISKPMLIFTKESEDSLRALRSAAGLDGPIQKAQPFAPDNYCSPSIEASDKMSMGSGLRTTNTSLTGHSEETERSVPRQRGDFGLAPRDRLDVMQGASNPFARMPLKKSSKVGPHARNHSDDTEGTQSSLDHDAELDEAVILTASRATSLHSARSSGCSNVTSRYIRDSVETAPVRPRLVQFTSARGVPAPMPIQTAHMISNSRGASDNRRVSQIAAVVSPIQTGTNTDADADAIMTEGMRYVRAFGDQNPDVGPARPSRSGSKRSSRNRGGLSPTTTNGSGSPIPTQSSYMYPSPSQSVDSGARDGKFVEGSSKGSKGSLVMSRIIVRSSEAFVFKYPVLLTCSLDPNSRIPTPLDEHRKLVARLLYNGGRLPGFLFHSVSSPVLTPSSSGKKWRNRYEIEFWGTPSATDVGEVVVGIFVADEKKDECVGRLVVDVVARG